MTTETITISFQKRTNISKATCEFLCKKLDQDEDEDLIRNISQLTSGQKKKLKVEEANVLVRRLLHLWNKAPDAIKKSLTIYSAKSEIKKYILTLPI